ncbi:type II citrate synthase domain protein [Leptospira interrogans serovar Canicola str. LT1962]|uniref:Type II citrate synthase domain protein n=1 Tax=Leptospira interrogans serovar Australis str. 200703203 TaxID=1085541 RepID=N1UJM9_LEPIR|nr:type II citrate synthase domain protein [Leptospira interrogans serovar Canicola str. LT1962]EMY25082.1 type II citrate synthase domain protein [Leptospira interrogans serovar Australis str. 200703203]
MSEFIEIKVGEKSYQFPLISGTDGKKGIDIRELHQKTGLISYDPGFLTPPTLLVESPEETRIQVNSTIVVTTSQI